MINKPRLRQLINEYFSEGDLRVLLFDLDKGIDYESLPGSKGEKIVGLITFMEHRGWLDELVITVAEARPNIDWQGELAGPQLALTPVGSGKESIENNSNPFTYGNPISDPGRFYGRRHEVDQIFSRLKNAEAESSSLVGGRRMGKTSLLKHISHPEIREKYNLDSAQYIFIYLDLHLVDSSTTPARLWDILLKWIGAEVKDPDIKYVIKEMRESKAFDGFDLADLFDEIDGKDIHIVLLLDDFENVTANDNFDSSFFYGLRALAIHHNLTLITSSRYDLIELTHSEEIRSSPFFNIFATINLELFDEEQAKELISQYLADTAVTFSDSEVRYILRLAGTYPFFLQAACYHLFEAHLQELIPDERINFLDREFTEEVGQHYGYYWKKANKFEQTALAILALMSNQTELPKLGLSKSSLDQYYDQSTQTLSRLEKQGLVTKLHGKCELFNLSFANWICEQLTDPSQEPFRFEL